jgi:hypothetical protein
MMRLVIPIHRTFGEEFVKLDHTYQLSTLLGLTMAFCPSTSKA